MFGPPLLIGDRVLYRSDSGKLLNGTVRWLGRLSAEFGQQMVVGVELVRQTNSRVIISCLVFEINLGKELSQPMATLITLSLIHI